MQITKNSLETAAGPSDWFTGTVYLDTIAAAAKPSRLDAAAVHFTPGSPHRLAHPLVWPDHLRDRRHRALPAPWRRHSG